MDFQKYLEENKNIQSNLLAFLDNEDDDLDYFDALVTLLKKLNIFEDKHKVKLFLNLLIQIANHHHQTQQFSKKIDQIIILFKNEITKYFSNTEIFEIFRSNKRVLLFLIEEKIITIDSYVFKKITSGKYLKANYPMYFLPEIKPFIRENQEKYDKIPDGFYEKRKQGENDSYICKLIRDDLIEEFIVYVNKNGYSLESKIEPSIYETNSILLKNDAVTLIEYAEFYGSIRIFTYLKNNITSLAPSKYNYAIHSRNAEIIRSLENSNFVTEKSSLEESIKCHHDELVNYILDNSDESQISEQLAIKSIKYYNFAFIQKEDIKDSNFLLFVKCGYYEIVKFLMPNLDINLIFGPVFFFFNLNYK